LSRFCSHDISRLPEVEGDKPARRKFKPYPIGYFPPWTNGQVERMNRTIKEATVKRYHYDSHAWPAAGHATQEDQAARNRSRC
jgi:hypothetical protein